LLERSLPELMLFANQKETICNALHRIPNFSRFPMFEVPGALNRCISTPKDEKTPRWVAPVCGLEGRADFFAQG
jgi:hypothetical protein